MIWTNPRAIFGIAAPLIIALPATAQDRSSDNAVTQAEDGFGFSVGRETIGIYTASSARGFSPHLRGQRAHRRPVFRSAIYADQHRLRILEHQGRPVRPGLSLRGPERHRRLRATPPLGSNPPPRSCSTAMPLAAAGWRSTGHCPSPPTCPLGYGLTVNHVEFPDGTDNWNHAQGAARPAGPRHAGVEILPFWTLSNDYNDEAGPFYIPGGAYLPPQPPARHFDGPRLGRFPLQRDQSRRARLGRARRRTG